MEGILGKRLTDEAGAAVAPPHRTAASRTRGWRAWRAVRDDLAPIARAHLCANTRQGSRQPAIDAANGLGQTGRFAGYVKGSSLTPRRARCIVRWHRWDAPFCGLTNGPQGLCKADFRCHGRRGVERYVADPGFRRDYLRGVLLCARAGLHLRVCEVLHGTRMDIDGLQPRRTSVGGCLHRGCRGVISIPSRHCAGRNEGPVDQLDGIPACVASTSTSTRRSGCRHSMSLGVRRSPLHSPGFVTGSEPSAPRVVIRSAGIPADSTR